MDNTRITIDEKPITNSPRDNTLRTIVIYQKENYVQRPRGYYLRTYSLNVETHFEVVSFGAGYWKETLIEIAARFNRKRLEQLAESEKEKIQQDQLQAA